MKMKIKVLCLLSLLFYSLNSISQDIDFFIESLDYLNEKLHCNFEKANSCILIECEEEKYVSSQFAEETPESSIRKMDVFVKYKRTGRMLFEYDVYWFEFDINKTTYISGELYVYKNNEGYHFGSDIKSDATIDRFPSFETH